MKIADQLDEMRAGFDAVSIVAFADLSSKMILCASAEKKIGQEHLDALCNKASAAFGPAFEEIVRIPRAQLGEAVIFDDDGVSVFLRSRDDASDGLCCRCGSDIDLSAFLAQARSTLTAISA